MNAIHARNTLENEACINEKGVIGVASNLVRVSFEYEGLAKYLLGRILVVDNIDNALLIAKKYKYTLRIVTLEGEQLNPGGSMTGGAFRNSSNLLGRRREIEELKQSVSNTNKQITQEKAAVADLRNQVAKYREALDSYNKLLRETHIRKNTIDVNLKQADLKLSEIIASYGNDIKEQASIDSEILKISESRNQVSGNLNLLDNQNEAARKEIENLGKTLEAKKSEEAAVALKIENLKISHSSIEQKSSFINENIERLCKELDNLEEEKTSIQEKIGETKELVSAKQADIELVKNSIEESERKITAIGEKLEDLRAAKEKVNASHKEFFKKREELNEKIILLEKDSMRLHNQYDRLEESYDSLVDYMWNEYELTYSYALELKSDELNNINDIRKQINILKAAIKKLGDVNVNAIEEYKSVSERYEFMKTQHDDMIEAEESLMKVIEELDEGMRTQFTAKFEEIKVEFDKVFKELFGGGRGTIELVEGEDILEAGILIISQPPGKKLQNMMQLSGGEKALTAIALLFAIQNLKPSPFCLLDEIEAALDDSNVGRYANYLHKLTKHTQFIVITHRRGTMSAADRLYGITMQEKGVSTLVSVDLIENDLNDRKKES